MLTEHIRFNRIIFRNQVFAPDYLNKSVDSVAQYLDSHNRSNSPIVYLHAPNNIKTVIAFLAILKSGRTCLLVDPETGALEYEEMLADTLPSAIIRLDPASIDFNFDKEFAFTDFCMDQALISQLSDVCIMLYTAAEDGHAKAAMLTHDNILSNAKAIAEGNKVDNKAISCAVLPFHHLFGFQNGVISPMVGGSSFLISDISNTQKISVIVNSLLRHEITHFYSVPLIYYFLSKSPYIHRLGHQTYSMISGGYKFSSPLRERFEKNLNIQIYEGYGLTEASPVCTWQFKTKKWHKDSIGLPISDYKAKIVDESNNILPFGRQGEICIYGSNIMKGYFNHPEATQKVIIDGWLHTGDYGAMDVDGNVFFLGLKKKMYNVAGKKIYPEEVRRLMMRNKNVEAVELWSEYDALMGDRIKAKVKLKNNVNDSENGFSRWCTQAIGIHKLPQKISFL